MSKKLLVWSSFNLSELELQTNRYYSFTGDLTSGQYGKELYRLQPGQELL